MTLDYIYHSGFALEAEGVTLVLDFYQDTLPDDPSHGLVQDSLLQRPGRMYVLASHFHPDHFNPRVLAWKERRPDICYLFSKDILKHRRAAADDALYLSKGDTYADDCLRVDAFGSTDVGVSFMISLQGMRLFHAGDLNNWHWKAESTPAEVRKAEGDFRAELNFIRRSYDAADVVLFPVDRRLGEDYMRGPRQFIETIRTGMFVPMHFGEDYEGGNAFRPVAEERGCRFCAIGHRGERFDLSVGGQTKTVSTI